MKPPWPLPVWGSDLFWLHLGTKVPVGSSVSRLATPVSHELECHRHRGQRSTETEQRSHFLGSRTRYCGETSFRDRQGVALGPGKAAWGILTTSCPGAQGIQRWEAEEQTWGRGEAVRAGGSEATETGLGATATAEVGPAWAGRPGSHLSPPSLTFYFCDMEKMTHHRVAVRT